MTPTRRPLKSTPPSARRRCGKTGPANRSRPAKPRPVGRGQAAGRHDQKVAPIPFPAVGLDPPAVAASSKCAALTAGGELDVPAQVETVGDVVKVAQDLWLGRVALGPRPLLLQLLGELVGVLHALDVAARAG